MEERALEARSRVERSAQQQQRDRRLREQIGEVAHARAERLADERERAAELLARGLAVARGRAHVGERVARVRDVGERARADDVVRGAVSQQQGSFESLLDAVPRPAGSAGRSHTPHTPSQIIEPYRSAEHATRCACGSHSLRAGGSLSRSRSTSRRAASRRARSGGRLRSRWRASASPASPSWAARGARSTSTHRRPPSQSRRGR